MKGLTCLKRDFISEPFNLQCGISNRNQSAFEVSCMSFGNGIDVLQRLSEHRSLPGLRFWHFWSLPRLLSLQFADLVHSFGPLRVENNIISWNYPQLDRGYALA